MSDWSKLFEIITGKKIRSGGANAKIKVGENVVTNIKNPDGSVKQVIKPRSLWRTKQLEREKREREALSRSRVS